VTSVRHRLAAAAPIRNVALTLLLIGCTRTTPTPLDGIAIIPRPMSVTRGNGEFTIDERTVIRASTGADGVARRLAAYLAPATGFTLDVADDRGIAAPGGIQLRLDRSLTRLGTEGYRLEVRDDGVRVDASAAAGLFYGVQTLRQLLPSKVYSGKRVSERWSIPAVVIEDRPRFSWRGLHLDVARHFMPVDVVKRYIELLALHKMNTFHWHLTDDQGWRIEIRKYPRLTQVGGWREASVIGWPRDSATDRYDGTRHGGFYTQEEIREVVAFARERFVNVVPEIEMPGHAQAAIAAYPELGVTGDTVGVWTRWGVTQTILNPEESTVRFMQDVLTEVLALFPSPFIHVGGDEAPKDQWKSDPRVQALIKQRGLKDEHEMQSWFIKQMDAWLAARGRRLIGWDEILEGGLAPNATVMSWRGVDGGIAAARAGHDVVMAPTRYTYFDSYQTEDREKDAGEPLAIDNYLPLERVYAFDPLEGLERQHWPRVLGAQGQLWTEYITDPSNLEYKAYPRATALAEVVWSTPERRDYADFLTRLTEHQRRLDALGVNYRR
jgi:hexosaminidase